MNIQRWIGRREPNWKRLDALLTQLEKKGLKSLKAKEIEEMASLYRSVSADLARAKTNQMDRILLQDLQKLTSRAYSQIYQGARRQEWRSLLDFCFWGFPAAVRQNWAYIALATAIFAGCPSCLVVLLGRSGFYLSGSAPTYYFSSARSPRVMDGVNSRQRTYRL